MRHLISPLDLSPDEVSDLLSLAEDIYSSPEKYSHCCTGKKLATLFYEPSTRTRLIFEAVVLNPGGRLAVITFHSLEDRIVKTAMVEASKGCTCPPNFPVCVCGKKPKVKLCSRKPIVASAEELEVNPRSRSAKLRVCEKL
jgi:hypothetical protein